MERSIRSVPRDWVMVSSWRKLPLMGSKYRHLFLGVRYSPNPVFNTKVPHPRGHGVTFLGSDNLASVEETETAACCRTFTTSNGVTARAVMVEPTVADTTLAHAAPWYLLLLEVEGMTDGGANDDDMVDCTSGAKAMGA